MAELAINGGTPVRTKPFPIWPIYGQDEERALIEVLHSGIWGVDGGYTKKFEEEFAAYHGARYGRTACNGTITLMISLLALDIKEGDEVIVPPYTFLATATAVSMVNAVPVFVDIDPDTYNLNPELVEAAITEKTKAIIPVHLGGMPADMDTILAIAKKNNLKVIEDAAHAHGSMYKGKKVGSFGDLGSFSFQSSKNLCSGEGGIIITDNEQYADMCDSFRNCGRLKGAAWYEHGILASNYRLSQFQAALLSAQLKRLDEQTTKRDRNGKFLDRELATIEGIRPLVRSESATRVAYHLYIFRYDSEAFKKMPKSKFVAALSAEGIPASVGYPVPLNKQPLFANKNFGPYTGYQHARTMDYAAQKFPVSEHACYDEAVWLHQPLLLGDQEDMADIVKAVRKIRAEI